MPAIEICWIQSIFGVLVGAITPTGSFLQNMCCWHVDRLLSEVFRCMHKAGLWRRSALPVSLQTLELVPSIFHNRGGKTDCRGEKCSPNKKLASHPSDEKYFQCAASPFLLQAALLPLEAGFAAAVTALVSMPRVYWRNLEATLQLIARSCADQNTKRGRKKKNPPNESWDCGEPVWTLALLALTVLSLVKWSVTLIRRRGLKGISCLGDGGWRWMEMYSWHGEPGARRGTPWEVKSPRALQARML